MAGPFEEFLSNREKELAGGRANIATQDAAKSSPDTVAEAAILAKQYQAPPAVVESDIDTFRRRAFSDSSANLLGNSPRLSSWTASFDNARKASDDLPTLGKVEQIISFGRPRPLTNQQRALVDTYVTQTRADAKPNPLTWGKAGQAVFNAGTRDLSAAAAGIGQGAVEFVDPIVSYFNLPGLIYRYNTGNTVLGKTAERLGKVAEKQQKEAQAAAPIADGVVAQGLLTGMRSLPTTIGALELGLANPTAGLGFAGAVTGGQSYTRGRSEGLTPFDAMRFASTDAGIEVATERLPFLRLLEDIKVGTPAMKRFTTNLAAENIGEQFATALQDFNQWASIDAAKGKSLGDYFRERPDAALQTFLATTASTVTLNAGITAAEQAAAAVERRADRADRAAEGVQTIQQIADLAVASKLRTRDIGSFEAFVQQAAEGSELTDVYVASDALEEVLNQGGQDPADIIASVPALAEQYEEARATGGDVRIPIEQFAGRLAGTDVGNALLQHLRVDPDDMSQFEAETFYQNAPEELRAAFEGGMAAEPTADETLMQGREVVKQQVLDQLKTANRFTSDVNDAYADLIGNFFMVMADRTGTTPQELAERYGLKVQAERVTDGEALDQDVIDMIDHLDEVIARGGPEADKAAELQDRLMAMEVEREAKRAPQNDNRPETPLDRARREAFAAEDAYNDFVGWGKDKTKEVLIPPRRQRKAYAAWQAEHDRLEQEKKDKTEVWLEQLRDTRLNQSRPEPLDIASEPRPERLLHLPKVSPGSFAPAREIAQRYVEGQGFAYRPPQRYAKVDQARAARVAKAFDAMPHRPNDPEVRASYDAMIRETLAQWEAIKETGLQVEFIEGADPYKSPWDAIRDVRDNNHLWVYPTDSGFGSSDLDVGDNPLLTIVPGEEISGKPVRANDIFRIVHDYFGHIKEGVGFRWDGEENAWRIHSAMYSPLARRAMTTETRGQNSWVNFGPHGLSNRTASSEKTVYADQKIGLLPDWVVNAGATDGPEPLSTKKGTKVVDENDKPKIVYHGTAFDFSWFKDNGRPIWFAERPATAGAYSDARRVRRVAGERLIPAMLDIRKPFDLVGKVPENGRIEDPAAWIAELGLPADAYQGEPGATSAYNIFARKPFADALKAAGYDGIRVEEANDITWGALSPDQIISPYDPSAPVLAQSPIEIEKKAEQLATQIPGLAHRLPYLSADEKAKLRKDTAAKIVAIAESFPSEEEMASVAFAGRAKRGWYERSALALLEVFGAEDAPRFAALLAALSPQTSVESNLVNTIKTWVNWEQAGRPTDRKAIVEILGKSVQGGKGVGSVLNAWINNSITALTAEDSGNITLSGPKVNSFMLNLQGVVDEVTNDTWMANYALVDQTLFAKTGPAPGKGAGYTAMNAVARKAAEVVSKRTGETWTPAEVQETVWSWMKTLYEKRAAAGEDRTAAEILAAGDLTHDEISTTPDFATLFLGGVYRRVLEFGGYGEQLGTLEGSGLAFGSSGAEGSVAEAEGSGLDEGTFRGHLAAAAARVDELRARRRGEELQQGEAFGNRGSIRFPAYPDITAAPSVIALLRGADLSTFIHESGHFFLEVMTDIARQPDAPQQIVDDFNATLKWFGFTPEEWADMNLAQRRDSHEKFARGFEAYLFEGKVPNLEMKGIFQRFRAWLRNVYAHLAQLNVELSGEVRQVFNRLMATDVQIAAAEQEAGLAPIFETKPEGMTDEEFAEYQALGASSTAEAINELERRSLRDMRWTANAEARKLKEIQKDVEARRKLVIDEAAAEVRSRPIYRAQEFLKKGMLDGAPVEGPHKLSIDEIDALYEDRPAIYTAEIKKALGYGKYGMIAKENAMHPAQVAELFGFTSADHLIQDLVAAQPIDEIVAVESEQKMLERFGDITSADAMRAAVSEALHNDVRARFVASEMAALSRAPGKPRLLAAAAKRFAEAMIARTKVRDIRPAQYEAAERRAARKAQEAFAAGDQALAATEKRNQLVNLSATRVSREALLEIDRAIEYLRKFDRESVRKKLDIEYIEQIDGITERFDLRVGVTNKALAKRQSLLQWIESQQAQGFEPTIPDELLDEARKVHYKNLTVEELRGVVDSVRNIEHLGRLKKKLLTAKDEREFAARRDEAVDTIRANTFRSIKEIVGTRTRWEKLLDGGAKFFAMHRKMASLTREMDGFKDGGPIWELFIRPMNEAGDKEAVEIEKSTIALGEIFKPIYGRALNKRQYIPEIGRSLSLQDRLMIALNQGNEINRLRIVEGDRWTPDQVAAILEPLTEQHWTFVQNVWDHINSYWPQIVAKERRVTGVEPEKVEAEPFVVTTSDGKQVQLKGGYFPIKYDPDRSTRSESDEAAQVAMQLSRGLYARAQTRRGHIKERVTSVKRPVRKDFGVIFEHVTQVIHDLSWHEYLIDANRLLNDNQVDLAIREGWGPAVTKEMRNTLTDIAVGDNAAQNVLERGVNYLRTGATIAGLGWNLMTSLLQPLGLTQSMQRVGTKWVARGIARVFRDATTMNLTTTWIYERSDFMRLRAKTMQREISEIRNRVSGKSRIRLGVEESYFVLIAKLQLMADVPTWVAQYEKSMAAGETEDRAAALADQAVIDSQGGGQIKDLASIQRGSPFQKLWTNFYSYFSVTYNRMAEAVNETRKVGPKNLPILAVDFALLAILPSVLTTLLRQAMTGGDDDWDDIEKKLIEDQASYMLGTMFGLREIGAMFGVGNSYSGPAGARIIGETVKLGKQAQQGEIDEAAIKAANNVAGVLFHYPAGQINRTVTGAQSVANGESGPEALLVGPRHN